MQSVAVTATYLHDEGIVRIVCDDPKIDLSYRLDDLDSLAGWRTDTVHEIAKMRVRVALMDHDYDPQLTGFMVSHVASGQPRYGTRSNLYVVLSQEEQDRLPFPI